MYVIYHDPGCTYSVICLAVLRAKKVGFQKVKYQKEPLTEDVLKDLINKLNIDAQDLVRKDHKCWKNVYSQLSLDENEIIHLLLENPELMIRPIIVNDNQAVIGRPPTNLIKFIDQSRQSIPQLQ